MSEFIKKFITRQFPNGEAKKIKGCNFAIDVKNDVGKVEICVFDGDEKQGQKSFLQLSADADLQSDASENIA